MINILKLMSTSFQNALKVSSKLADSLGVNIFLVGGVARDLIIKRQIIDLDILVEADAIDFASKLSDSLGGSFSRHHAFGTATVFVNKCRIDLATARTEKYYHHGALPKVTQSTVKRDLFRRDFTINSMAIGLNKKNYGHLIDLYGGVNDLKKGLVRVLHDKSFLDDPTRILRAIRFEQRFKFQIEKHTLRLLRLAVRAKALSFVGPHRLKEEIISVLKELNPYGSIRRIDSLEGFNFLDKTINLDKNNYSFLLKIKKATESYKKKFNKHRDLQLWVIYFSGILANLSLKKIVNILDSFGFKKGERIIVKSTKEDLSKIKKLEGNLSRHCIYSLLSSYSFESIIFFYIYYSDNKNIKIKINLFLKELVNIRIRVKGRDLKLAGFKPFNLYSKILKKLLYSKIDKGFRTKGQELKEAQLIFKKLLSANG